MRKKTQNILRGMGTALVLAPSHKKRILLAKTVQSSAIDMLALDASMIGHDLITVLNNEEKKHLATCK